MRDFLKPFWPFVTFLMIGFVCGYQYPRDMEIESTKPVVLNYEISNEAAKTLIFRAASGFTCDP